MIAVLVKSSSLFAEDPKFGRIMNAEHWTGNPKFHAEEVARAEQNLKNAKARLKRVKQAQAESAARAARLIAEGKVKVLGGPVRPHWHNEDGEPLCEEHALGVEGDLNSNETDVPENCIVCGRPCEYTLTAAGVRYVLEHAEQILSAGVYDTVLNDNPDSYYHGSRSCEVVRDWVKELQWYGGLTMEQLALLNRFLEVTAEAATA